MQSALRASAASDRPANAAIIPFPTRAERAISSSSSKLSRYDRNVLISFGYAVPGWLILLEQDGLGMQWAALCPPGAGTLVARYIVGREDNALVLLTGSGRTVGRYRSADQLVAHLRRRERPKIAVTTEGENQIPHPKLRKVAASLLLIRTEAQVAEG